MSWSSEHAAKWIACLLALTLAAGSRDGFAAADHYGQITFSGLPVPGATVVATKGDKTVATVSDQQGVYRFADLADGVWTIRVEMLGFSTLNRDVTIASDSLPPTWNLTLLSFEEMARGSARPLEASRDGTGSRAATTPASQAAANRPPNTSPSPSAPPPGASGGFQRAGVNASAPASPAPNATVAGAAPDTNSAPIGNDASPFRSDASGTPGLGAADGFLINGSVNNGAASPFAQSAAFGNNRRGSRSLYTGGLGVILGNSAWDARPYSFTGQQMPKPAYTDTQFLGTFGGPLRIPRVLRNGPTLFVGYQRSADHNATTQSALMPTSFERHGDFSQTLDALGRPVEIRDPATGQPFAGNVIPPNRIAPQAAALLGYYPGPNVDATGRYNYQAPLLVAIRQDSVQSRLSQSFRGRNQLFGNFAYQRMATDATSLFGFTNSTTVSGVDTAVNWSHRLSMFLTLRLRYQFTRLSTDVTPHFSNQVNVSGNAGISGNNQEPVNWGPPRLIFSSGVAGLGDAQYARNRNQTNAWNAESLWSHGRHAVTVGGDLRRQQFNVLSQQDARGAFTFTGSAAGSDLADFLLGLPHASSIAFGNADKYLRQPVYDAYVNDDWRLTPVLTVNAGVRWEYEMPITETRGRLANLDVAPGFSAVSPIVSTDPVGALTGERYPESLVRPDWRGVQPRVGVAWRPVPGSSLVIRGGYGVYRNTAVYQSIAMLLAQQPPLSKTSSVENSEATPLTLANGFVSPGGASNTFAIDPDFRVGGAQNWQISAQRDLPASLTISGTYLGTRGSRLMQEFLPNTYPLGATNPCPTCPAGFVYLASNGASTRHAGQFQARRRLRNGLAATVQYTVSKALDNAAAFSGAGLSGASIAQDWLSLDADRGPSNFDQRHLVSAQFQYTTGVGVNGGALLTGLKGSLFKGWTVTSQLTAGSGLPLTPVYLTSVTGTGVTGTIRADLTGVPTGDAPPGYYLNPASYSAPEPGRWGNARRNSGTGPSQFGLSAGIARTFPWGERINLDWRIDATNVLNRVTFAAVNATLGSSQFGLPILANQMRRVQSTLRLRF